MFFKVFIFVPSESILYFWLNLSRTKRHQRSIVMMCPKNFYEMVMNDEEEFQASSDSQINLINLFEKAEAIHCKVDAKCKHVCHPEKILQSMFLVH